MSASCMTLHLNALRVHNGDEQQDVPEDVRTALACPHSKFEPARYVQRGAFLDVILSPCSHSQHLHINGSPSRLDAVNEWIRGVIVYVEDTTIRSLPVAARHGLKSTDPAVWFPAVRQYVSDLQCPISETRQAEHGEEKGLVVSAGALTWVLGHAVGLAYDDGVAGTQGYDDVMSREVLHSGVSYDADVSDCILRSEEGIDAAAAAAFGKVCESLAVHRHGADIAMDDIDQCIYRIEHEMLPFLTNKKAGVSLDDEEAIKQAIPLGFSTGDDAVDKAARVLRILHIKELRRLQNVVDDAIAAHQNVTANPRTEAGPKRRRKKKA